MNDRCELCGASVDGAFRVRIAHLRASHAAYARALVFRLVAPLVFLVGVLGLSAVRAPQQAYLVALFAGFGVLFMGKVKSRSERARAGARPTLPIGRLVREGGLGIVLIVPLVVVLLLVAGGR